MNGDGLVAAIGSSAVVLSIELYDQHKIAHRNSHAEVCREVALRTIL